MRHGSLQRPLFAPTPLLAAMALILLLVLSAIGQQCATIPASVGTAASTSTSTSESIATDIAQAPPVDDPTAVARATRIASPSEPTDNQLGIPGCEGRDDGPATEPDVVRTAQLWDVTTPTASTVETVTASTPDATTPQRRSDHISSPTPQELCISRT